MLCPRFIGIPLVISQGRHGFDIEFLGVSRGQLFKLQKNHSTCYDYSCPLIDTSEVTSWFECRLKSQYIGSQGRYSEAITGFPGHQSGSGRQLPVIDIEIRGFILQV